ncbi:hypothetical protein HDU91_003952 [Kappamyces sp. JEL0680]|nr:hypothetical protein HDU91_003952 [Kappamyces sp. JEL0680]
MLASGSADPTTPGPKLLKPRSRLSTGPVRTPKKEAESPSLSHRKDSPRSTTALAERPSWDNTAVIMPEKTKTNLTPFTSKVPGLPRNQLRNAGDQSPKDLFIAPTAVDFKKKYYEERGKVQALEKQLKAIQLKYDELAALSPLKKE